MNDHQFDHEHEPSPVSPVARPVPQKQKRERPPARPSPSTEPRSDVPLWSSEEPPAKPFEPPKKLGIKPEFTARAKASRAALRAEAPDASELEHVSPVAEALHDLLRPLI